MVYGNKKAAPSGAALRLPEQGRRIAFCLFLVLYVLVDYAAVAIERVLVVRVN